MATVGIGSKISITGLASGIDTQSIIDGITALNARRIQILQAQKAQVTIKRTTFSDLRGKLLELQAQSGRLSRTVAGAFDARTAVASDPEALVAAASSSAAAGQYTVTIDNLAQAHQLASENFAAPGTTIKQGTLTLKVGAGPATTVTIDSTNNTLQGLAEAINASGGEARAAVINDGTATPYRLLLTSTKTGAANAIQLTNNLTGGSGASINPANTIVQAAADARVRIGALSVSSATNRVDKLISGVTLDLKKADPAKPITITVAPDSAGAADAVEDFVASFNAVVDYIDQRDNFDPTTQQAGVLLGNYDAINLQRELTTTLTGSVSGVNQMANRLSAVGIKLTDKGKLELDRTKFESAFNGGVSGVAAEDVKRLFALGGTSTSPGVKFLLGGSKTQPSGATPYQVDVTQAATRGAARGTNVIDGTNEITAANNTFSLKLDNRQSGTLTLAAGTYTDVQLAAAVQAAINADPALVGSQVVVDLENDKLRITSQRYGGDSQVAIGAGSAVTSGILGFTGTETGAGLNVAGTFLVGGVVETAVGIGQVLSGTSGNAHTDGLQVSVTLSPSQIVAGPEADLTITRGLAENLNLVLNRYVDATNGRLKGIDKRYVDQTAVFDENIERQNAVLEDKTASLLRQFAAMELAVNRLNALSLQISAQFPPPGSSTTRRR